MRKKDRLAKFANIDIYPVTCEKLSAGRSDIDVLNRVIEGGAQIVQLREKELSKRDLFQLAHEFRKITERAGILLIVNDHLDIALAVDADGVHLGQDDLPVTAARDLAPELIIGASTHSVPEAIQAQADGADYANIGPIFPTKTKQKAMRFLGPDAIPDISSHISLPFTVMGGINADNIDQVVAKGARRIAVVSAVTKAPDIAGAVRRLREKVLAASM